MTENTLELRSGLQVDHYELIEPAGVGASGEVWLATYDDEQRALKFMNERLLQGKDAPRHRARFQSEINALETLTPTPHIPKLYGYNITAPRPYLAMSYINAPSWGSYIHSGELARVPLRQRLGLLDALASAIAAVHDVGYLHRDIKPSNIHGIETPTVIDFSVAIAREEAANDPDVGTAIYMPPSDGHPPDERSDNFAFGVVAYEMLFGVHPIFPPTYQPPSLPETRAEIQRRLLSGDWGLPSSLTDARLPGALRGADLNALDDLFSRALGPRNARYHDLTELMDDLRAAVLTEANADYIDHIPNIISAPEDIPVSQDYTLHEVRKVQQQTNHPPPPPPRMRRRRRRGLILTAILFALGLIAVFLVIFSLRGT